MNDVTIIILTFRREHLVEKTILSCVNQRNILDLKFEIVVVDNSPDKSAETIVSRLAKKHITPITYVSEPRQNISLARNAGIVHSNAQFIVFIDDDEQASQDWLDHLVRTQRKYDADAVFGPTTPIFENGASPRWDPNALFYTRNLNTPTGTPVLHGYTCNVLYRYEGCLSEKQPFEPEFGLTGGGDLDISLRLSKMGRRFVWCSEARVTEIIPENRSTIRYILRRSLRGGQTFVWCSVRNSDRPVPTASYWMLVGLAQIGVWLIPGLILAPFETRFSVTAKSKLAQGVGKVFWTKYFRIRIYK